MYTATEIQKALCSPDRLFRFRYELLDKENERKGELDNVLDASVSYDSEAEIKRTARFTLAEKDNIDYPSDRIKPYAIYKMPDKEKIIETEYEALDDSTIWRRGELIRTAAPVDLELGPSPNRCPPFNEWFLSGNATIENDVLCLNNYTAKAESPLINLDGAKFWFSADFFRGLGDAPQPWELDYPYFARLIKLVYYTEDLEVTGTPLTMFNISGFNRPSTNATFRKIAYTVYDDSYKPIPVDTWYRDMMQGPRTGYPAKYIKIILSLDSAWTPPDYKIRNPMVTTTGHWQDFMKYGGYWLDGNATIMLQKPWTVEAVKSSLIEWEEVIPTGASTKVEVNVAFDGETWEGWATCTNGNPIPHLGKGVNLKEATIKYRMTLTGDSTETPRIKWLRIYYNGYAKEIIPGKEVEFPLGVFLLSTPSRKIDDAGVITRDIEAYDQLLILKEDKTTGTFLIEAGTLFVDAIKNILTGAGIQHYNITYTNLALPVDREWEGGTPKLEIINELLEAMNYQPLWFDEHGYAIVRPYERPDVRTVEMVYRDDEESVIVPTMEETYDFFDVPNRFVLVVSEPEMDEIKSIYTNDNPGSPTSTVNRGRVITEYRRVEAPDKDTLDSLAERAAYEASQVYQTVTMDTGLMPIHSHNNMVRLEYTKFGITADYEEVSWSFDLDAGATMKHVLRRIVPV